MRQELTDRGLRNLRPALPKQRYELADSHVIGLRVRVGDDRDPRGRATNLAFVLLARFGGAGSNPTRRKIGSFPAMSIADARLVAIRWKVAIEKGSIPDSASPKPKAKPKRVAGSERAIDEGSFNALADNFLKRHVDAIGLRSAREVKRQFERYLRPHFGSKQFRDIRRRDVIALLDAIADQRGAVMADRCLATMSRLFSWQQARDDEFVNPIVKGMRRVPQSQMRRDRVLDQDEIRAIWAVADTSGTFGAFIQIALLTAQRRDKVLTMRWSDLDDNIWRISTEPREKTHAGQLFLPPFTMEIIRSQPVVAGSPYVFTGRGIGPINGMSKCKARFDADVAEALGAPLPNWRVHDLRRTARTLMSKVQVRRDISERVLGHAIPGVEGIYDRYDWMDEKAEALARLATHIDGIVQAPGPRKCDQAISSLN
jgi:integrase